MSKDLEIHHEREWTELVWAVPGCHFEYDGYGFRYRYWTMVYHKELRDFIYHEEVQINLN